MSGRARILGALLLVASVGAAYLPSLRGGYLWDDDVYVTSNPALRSAEGLADVWKIPPATRQYYPLTFTLFWLEYRAWGPEPLGYRVVNLLLHAINALLVWRLLALLGVPWAFFAAWVFALHPLQVESVAWIAELKNLLSGMFALLATIVWVRDLGVPRPPRLVLVAVLFALALLSKTQVCALPLILLALTWWKQPARLRAVLAPLAALCVLAIAAAMTTVAFETSAAEVLYPKPALDGIGRVLLAGRALWFYVGTFLWPVGQRAIYGHWVIDAADPLAYAFPLAAAVVGAGLWLAQPRIGRGPFAAVAVFVLCLAPALGFVDFGFMLFAFVADHFAYLAVVPLAALAVFLLGRMPKRAFAAVMALVLALLGGLTWRRAEVHADAETLWRDNIARDPTCAAAYDHLGVVLFNRGRLAEAVDAFAAAASRQPDLVNAQHNWGMALQRQRRFDEAIARYEAALRLRPDSRAIRNSIGVTLQAKGDLNGAARAYEDLIRLDPTYAHAHANLGTILILRGDALGAIERLETALRLRPDYAEAEDNLGVALRSVGRNDEAIAHFRRALRLDPDLRSAQRHLAQ